MPTLRDRIVEILTRKPGLTDRELTTLIFSASRHPAQINQECRLLAKSGVITRRDEAGVLRNYLGGAPPRRPVPEVPHTGSVAVDILAAVAPPGFISEDDVKRGVKTWLEGQGWAVEVKWGRDRGIDVVAKRGRDRWIIEAKGSGSLPAMKVNFFVGMLGETLQRMTDPAARYSIALPDIPSYHGLWERLPPLAKSRTSISVLFVDQEGTVRHLKE